ncbi:hypothetical protein TNIN_113921 [Trichonephila inaurata madagascariensis]|uniref:Uncharacterized protein n=1 Tax=Trichonephila inaurata madagascariensis TaxID=2747483 RepID=A0A8X6K9H4_9ARAC|nr:hypothetical protein TNIN_113921 [Trichonephila inaurata madagascariensis]
MMAEYIQGYPLYFLDIIAHNLILELIKDLIWLYFVNRENAKKNKLVVELKEYKHAENVLPVVYSLTVYKICLGLGLEAQLSDEPNRPIWISKKQLQKKDKPVVYSETILKFCEALNIEARLELSNERELPTPKHKEKGKLKYIPTVHSFMVFKICEALDLKVELNTEI